MRNPLVLPGAAVDALLTLSEVASRLPSILAEAEVRAQTVMEDIAAMRAAVEPLEERMEQLEREMRAMHESLGKGMSATERGMKETAKLQGITNDRIGEIGDDVKPLGRGSGTSSRTRRAGRADHGPAEPDHLNSSARPRPAALAR
jgi:tetrahydromethanopterin S-methyltransferase subunit H